MRISTFTVRGFANFTEPVTVRPLGELNILYGANNAGKSNLLRSVELYFRLLGAGEVVTRAQMQMLEKLDEPFQQLIDSSLNRKDPQPIVFEVEWTLTDKDLESAGLFAEVPSDRILTVLELKRINRAQELRIQKWVHRDQDVSQMDRGKNAAVIGFAQQIRRLLSDATPFQFEHPVLPTAHLGKVADGFPQSLRDAIFDARQSSRPEQRKRWQLFSRLAAHVRAEIGAGEWDTTFERSSGKADLIYLRDEDSLTLADMGSGVQRLVALAAELCLAREPYVLLEEPEWRLSPELQRRLASMVKTIIQNAVGPRQVFCTTHSPFLAQEGRAFAVELIDGTPLIEEQPWSLGAGQAAPSDQKEDAADLGGLIDLVGQLAELDPDAMLEESPGNGNSNGNGKGSSTAIAATLPKAAAGADRWAAGQRRA